MAQDSKVIQIDVDLTDETHNILQSGHNELSTKTSELLTKTIEHNQYQEQLNKQQKYEKSPEYKIEQRNKYFQKCLQHVKDKTANNGLCPEAELLNVEGCTMKTTVPTLAYIKQTLLTEGLEMFVTKIGNIKMIGTTPIVSSSPHTES